MKARGMKGGGTARTRGDRVRTPHGPGELITAWRPQRGFLTAHLGPPPLFLVVELDDGRRGLFPAEQVTTEPEPERGSDAATGN